MMMDTWKIFNAFMRKEAMKGLRVPLERNPWRFPESQVQAVKKKRNLLFSVRIGLLGLILPYTLIYKSCWTRPLVFDFK